MRKHIFCQSCGMPFGGQGLPAGHETDGSPSAAYCHLCYDGGQFLQPAIKRSSMQHLVAHALQRGGWSRPAAWLATRHIPLLARWRSGAGAG